MPNCSLGSDALYIGADMDVDYDEAQDADGNFLNTGTCTWTLYNSTTGVQVATGSMAYIVASDGHYRGVIQSTTTSTLTADDPYHVTITFADGGYNDFRRIDTFAAYRK